MDLEGNEIISKNSWSLICNTEMLTRRKRVESKPYVLAVRCTLNFWWY